MLDKEIYVYRKSIGYKVRGLDKEFFYNLSVSFFFLGIFEFKLVLVISLGVYMNNYVMILVWVFVFKELLEYVYWYGGILFFLFIW